MSSGAASPKENRSATPPPKKNHPPETSQNHPRTEASEVEGKGLTVTQLAAKIGKTRQAIESARDKGMLGAFGYRAEKNGRNWFYWSADEE